ncbi:MAG: hypothetical protein PHW72_00675 [Candidatus Pacebacteria bacterium]|nr:hypothetical protein [Candidatus Paceibacterota bacterium]
MKKVFWAIVFSLIVLPLFTQAAPLVPCGGDGQEKCTFCHLFVLADNIVDFVLFKIVPWIALAVTVTGGINLYFSLGKPEERSSAIKKLIAAAVGFVIVYASFLLIGYFFTVIGVSEWTGLENWFEYPCFPE